MSFIALTRYVLIVVLVGLIQASTVFAAGADELGGNKSCVRILPTTSEAPDSTLQKSFSARQTTDVLLNVIFQTPVTEEYVVTITVYTPKGHLYRTIDMPVVVDTGHAPGTRRITGYRNPVPAQTTRHMEIDGERLRQVITATLPLAGSTIVSSSLYGKWRAQVSVNTTGQLCTGEVKFEIVE